MNLLKRVIFKLSGDELRRLDERARAAKMSRSATIRAALSEAGVPKDVSSVMHWYRAGVFKTPEHAKGAFALAYQQALDGMGPSVAAWMGMTNRELDDWIRYDALPFRKSAVGE